MIVKHPIDAARADTPAIARLEAALARVNEGIERRARAALNRTPLRFWAEP